MPALCSHDRPPCLPNTSGGAGAIRITEYDADVVVVIVGALVTLVLFLGVAIARLARARRKEARMNAVRARLLADAAAVLGLDEPRVVEGADARWVCAGKLCGLDAELGSSVALATISVALVVEGLGDVQVTRRPTGRAAEDFYIGVAVDSGHPRFDAHHCLRAGSRACIGQALTDAAKTVPRTLLDFAADHFDRAYDITLSANKLVVQPVWEPMREPSDDLVALWRHAEGLVRDGLDRAVLRSKH